jgi:hypothetical protein
MENSDGLFGVNHTFVPTMRTHTHTEVTQHRKWTENCDRSNVLMKTMRLLWIEFGALTLLVSSLVLSMARRQSRQRKPGTIADRLPGHGFDATPVNQRLIRLRQNHLAGAGMRPRRSPGHDLFVAAVRRSLVELSFFSSLQKSTTKVAAHDTEHGPT